MGFLKVCDSGFRFISRWQNNSYSQCLLFNFRVKLVVFYEQTLYWPHSWKMYPKFTCSCRVEISFGNKQVFYSDVYISLQIRILLSKHFLVHRFDRRDTKNTPWFFKGTAISAITLHACNICNNITCIHILFCRQPCLFLFQQKIMCLIGISNFLTGFLLLSIYVKMRLFRLIR